MEERVRQYRNTAGERKVTPSAGTVINGGLSRKIQQVPGSTQHNDFKTSGPRF